MQPTELCKSHLQNDAEISGMETEVIRFPIVVNKRPYFWPWLYLSVPVAGSRIYTFLSKPSIFVLQVRNQICGHRKYFKFG